MILAKDLCHKREMNDKKPHRCRVDVKKTELRTISGIRWGAWAGHSLAFDGGYYAQNLFAVSVGSEESVKRPSDQNR